MCLKYSSVAAIYEKKTALKQLHTTSLTSESFLKKSMKAAVKDKEEDGTNCSVHQSLMFPS